MNAPMAGALFAVALLKLSPLGAAPIHFDSCIRGRIDPLDGVSDHESSGATRPAPLTQSLEVGAGLSSGMGDGTLVRWAMENGTPAHFDPVAPIPPASADGGSIQDVGPCFPPYVWTTGLLLLLCVLPSHRRRRSARVF
jgi:hypothetical protein